MKLGRESWLLGVVPAVVLIGVMLTWSGDGPRREASGVITFQATTDGSLRTSQEVERAAAASAPHDPASSDAAADPTAVVGRDEPGADRADGDGMVVGPELPLGSTWTRVLRNRNGEPISGATIEVTIHRNLKLGDDVPVDAPGMETHVTLKTGPDGLISLVRIPGYVYTIKVRADGYGTEAFPVIDDREDSLILDAAAVVMGQVRRRGSGEIVSGASVTFDNGTERFTLTTDSEGRFRIDGANARRAQMFVSGNDFMAMMRSLENLRAGAANPVEFLVDAGSLLEGEVVDATTQEPLANAAILVMDRWTKTTVSIGVSDGQGRFSFASLNAAHDYSILAMRGGYFGNSLARVGLSSRRTHVRLQMAHSWALGVQVGDAGGAPIAGALVRLSRTDQLPIDGASKTRDVFTGENGLASFGNLARELRYKVTILRDGFGAVELSPIDSGGNDQRVISAGLVPTTLISGRVVDDLGAPIPYATVRATRTDGVSAPALFVIADDDGYFSFTQVASGGVLLVAFKGGFDNARLPVALTEGNDAVDLTLTMHTLGTSPVGK